MQELSLYVDTVIMTLDSFIKLVIKGWTLRLKQIQFIEHTVVNSYWKSYVR